MDEFGYLDLEVKIKEADYVLIGIGEEFSAKGNEDELVVAYNNLSQLLDGKYYYIVSLCEDGIIHESELKDDSIVEPLLLKTEDDEKKWEAYLKWLSCTLNRKLLILELGVSLNAPQIIRWPFEKTAMLNQKANMIRINEKIANIPSEISDKAIGINKNAYEFLQFED